MSLYWSTLADRSSKFRGATPERSLRSLRLLTDPGCCLRIAPRAKRWNQISRGYAHTGRTGNDQDVTLRIDPELYDAEAPVVGGGTGGEDPQGIDHTDAADVQRDRPLRDREHAWPGAGTEEKEEMTRPGLGTIVGHSLDRGWPFSYDKTSIRKEFERWNRRN